MDPLSPADSAGTPVKLRFLHIPKTAGSTFTGILYDQYGARRSFQFAGEADADRQRYDALSASRRSAIRLFCGHAPIDTSIPDANGLATITFLRDPVSRVKSFCQHVSEGKSGDRGQYDSRGLFDLDLFLDSGNGELANLQTKMLLNRESCVSSEVTDSMTQAEAIAQAKANLFGRVTAFGLQEFFDESLVVFRRKFGWQIPVYLTMNKHDSARRIRFEERHIKKIEELNQLDLEVYKAAHTEFLKTLESSEFDRAELARLQTLQRFAHYPLRIRRFKRQLTGVARRLLGR